MVLFRLKWLLNLLIFAAVAILVEHCLLYCNAVELNKVIWYTKWNVEKMAENDEIHFYGFHLQGAVFHYFHYFLIQKYDTTVNHMTCLLHHCMKMHHILIIFLIKSDRKNLTSIILAVPNHFWIFLIKNSVSLFWFETIYITKWSIFIGDQQN